MRFDDLIKEEQDAVVMYKKLAKQVRSVHDKKILLKIANQEGGHVKMLQSMM